MIVVYPMLTSASVSPNVLPGIIKAVEKYILIYNIDSVLKTAGATSAGNIIATGAAAIGHAAGGRVGGELTAAVANRIINADKDNTMEDGDPIVEAPTYKQTATGGGSKKIMIKVDPGKKDFKEPITMPKSDFRPSLDIPRGDAISLEPTWVHVTTKRKGLQLLGVKVVPFRVKSAAGITALMSQDNQMKYMDYLSKKYGRGIIRVLFRIMQRMKIPRIHDKALTGDPRKDLLLGQTQYRDNMFMCLSQMDLENENLFATPRGIQKLHKLGWASMIIVDDVNRRTTFCMKEFGGVCSVVPFNFMFTSVSKDMNQAYEDLEDIKRSSGPFFSMKTNRRRAFSETVSQADKYLQLIQGKDVWKRD